MRPRPLGGSHEEQSHAAGCLLVQSEAHAWGEVGPGTRVRTLRNLQCAAISTGSALRKNEAAMDTIPNGNAEQKFQELLTKLMATPAWTEKQQIELEMARDISVEMLRLAELMRDGSVDLETCLTMLKYAKVLDFVMTTLASRRDIKPQTLRVIFKLAGLKVDEEYPG
jgi:hypothetical protein